MKLNTINAMLSSLGNAPITTLTSQDPYVKIALELYDRVDKKLQSQGWWFNTRIGYGLTLDSNNQIVMPSNALSLHPDVEGYSLRGNLLFDVHKGSVTFNEPDSVPKKIDYIYRVDSDELPIEYETLLDYACCYEILINLDGEEVKIRRTAILRDEAYILAKQAHLRHRRHTVSKFKSLGGKGYARS